MSSEFAELICQTYFNNTEGALLRNVIDAELAEVREVLDGLIEFSDQVIEAWEIKPLPAHRVCLERARELYGKLVIK